MGKYDDDDDEEYFVKKGDKWVPIDLGGKSSNTKSSKSNSSEEFFIKRDGRWVKVEGVSSTDDIIQQLRGGRSARPGPTREIISTTVQPPPQSVVQTVAKPAEYREYYVVINQPPAPPPVEPVPAQPEPQPEPPRRAVPNHYSDRPVEPQRRVDYRGLPPGARRRLPPPTRQEPPIIIPPGPPPPRPYIVEPEPEIDAFELGRAAYRRERVITPRLDYERCERDCSPPRSGPPRTSPAPGYYLAGYLYYGDPSQPKPILQPTPAVAPPGTYLAGFTSGGSSSTCTAQTHGEGECCCGYPNHPSTVELEIDEYGYEGEPGFVNQGQGYAIDQGYAANEQGYDQGNQMQVYTGYPG